MSGKENEKRTRVTFSGIRWKWEGKREAVNQTALSLFSILCLSHSQAGLTSCEWLYLRWMDGRIY